MDNLNYLEVTDNVNGMKNNEKHSPNIEDNELRIFENNPGKITPITINNIQYKTESNIHNVKVIFSYNGNDFNGWHGDETNPNCRYLQKSIQSSLFLLLNVKIDVFCAGRTDSGVHGIGQVCSFFIPHSIDLYKLSRVLEYHGNIGVQNVEYVSHTFHARFSAVQRQYMYLISCINSPIIKDRAFYSKYKLNILKMQQVCDFILQQNDLAFFAPKYYTGSTRKTMDYLYVDEYDFCGIPVIRINVGSKSFFHHQIRNIVGCLYEVGRGNWSIEHFINNFNTQDRNNCAMMMNPCGLYFLKAKYE